VVNVQEHACNVNQRQKGALPDILTTCDVFNALPVIHEDNLLGDTVNLSTFVRVIQMQICTACRLHRSARNVVLIPPMNRFMDGQRARSSLHLLSQTFRTHLPPLNCNLAQAKVTIINLKRGNGNTSCFVLFCLLPCPSHPRPSCSGWSRR